MRKDVMYTEESSISSVLDPDSSPVSTTWKESEVLNMVEIKNYLYSWMMGWRRVAVSSQNHRRSLKMTAPLRSERKQLFISIQEH